MEKMLIGLVGPAGSGKDTIADHLVKKYGFVKMANADLLKRMAKLAFDFTDEQLWGPSELRNAPDTRYPREHGPLTEDFKCRVCGAQVRLGVDLKVDALPQCYLTPRFALQSLGTEWGRLCFENIWVGRLLGLAQELQAGGCYYDAKSGIRRAGSWVNGPEVKAKTNVVITDVRFKNEIEAIKAAGGKAVRVIRPIAATMAAGEDGVDILMSHDAWTLQGNAALLAEHTSVSASAGQHKSETELLGIPMDLFDHVFHNSGDLHVLKINTDRMMDVLKGKIIAFDRGLQDAPPFLREKCKALVTFMSELSLKYFKDPWSKEMPPRLWYALANKGRIDGDFDVPYVFLEPADVEKLKALAEHVPGWFSWKDGSYDAPYFVERADWIKEYEEHRK